MEASQRRCDGVSRRDFLHVGALAGFGLSLSGVLGLRAAVPSGKAPKASSCILIWLDGGPSHLDTFDPKPEAPVEVRSPFRAIPSSLDGVQVCEHLPKTAKILRETTLIRSLTHELGNHDTGSRFLLTGHRPGPSVEHPSLGSLVCHHHGSAAAIPPYVAVPGDGVGGNSGAAGPGFLGSGYSAFNVGADPGRVKDLELPSGVTLERGMRRQQMLERVDAFSRRVEEEAAERKIDPFFEEAFRLVASPEAKSAFDLGKEPVALREGYGSSRLGSGCLLARRLVERGARFVTVVDHGWDTHQQVARELPDTRFPGSGKLPGLDRAYASLITDLKERGLLASTLVVLMGEFGRTPKLNAAGGRDHWPRAGFACLAGGGVASGRVIGTTDAHGESPVDRPVGPQDLAATILTLLGVDVQRQLMTPGGRPVRVLDGGNFIEGLT